MSSFKTLALLLVVGSICTVVVAEWNSEMENQNLFEGDIILNDVQKRALNSPNTIGLTSKKGFNKHWPKGVPIPYEFSTEFSQNAGKKQKILAAFADYERNTCLKFIPRTNQKQFMHFRKGNGCYTSVGMQYSGNFIQLADGCFGHGTLIHEIMHGLGVWHEQSRADRGQHIKINYHNMKCCKSQFAERGYTIDSLGFPYDLQSVMHYGPWAFSNGNGPTIEPLDKTKRIYNHGGFSSIDIQQLNAMYCNGPLGSGTTTTTTRAPVTSAPRGKLFQQVSSNKCLDLDQNDNLIFSSRCQTRFEAMEGKLFASNTPALKCAKALSSNSESGIRFIANCNQGFKKVQQGQYFVLQHKQTGKCIHPNRGSSNPSDGTKAVIYHDCNAGSRIQFKEG